jgi:hypothetical protein
MQGGLTAFVVQPEEGYEEGARSSKTRPVNKFHGNETEVEDCERENYTRMSTCPILTNEMATYLEIFFHA